MFPKNVDILTRKKKPKNVDIDMLTRKAFFCSLVQLATVLLVLHFLCEALLHSAKLLHYAELEKHSKSGECSAYFLLYFSRFCFIFSCLNVLLKAVNDETLLLISKATALC